MVLEIVIISTSPWLFWMMDLSFKAGDTLISEYSFIILMRWLVIIVIERSLLSFMGYFIIGLLEKLVMPIRMLGSASTEQSQIAIDPIFKRNVGRPRKNF